MKKYLLVCFLVTLVTQSIIGQTFNWSTYTQGSTAQYTQTNSSVTLTWTTAATGAANWQNTCGAVTPQYRGGTDFSPCMSPQYGLVWSVDWADRTSSVLGTITFSTTVTCPSFTIYDINRNPADALCSNIWTDVIEVIGYNGATEVLPSFTQENAAHQTMSTSGNKRIATGNEGGAATGVSFSFSGSITKIEITYKSAASISSSTGCAGGSTNPRQQHVVIGTVSASTSSYGTLNGGSETICFNGDPANITFSSAPSGSPTYQWYYKDGNNSCPTGSSTAGWTPISGATSSSYNPPIGLTTTTTYACFVNNGSCAQQWASNCKTVTINTSDATSAPALSTNDYLWKGSDVIYLDAGETGTSSTGSWTNSSGSPFYGSIQSKFANQAASATATYTYNPTIITTGQYEVFEWHTASSNRGIDVPFQINHAGGTTNITINQSINGGTWVSLGTFTFNSGSTGNIIISNSPVSGTGKVVIADGIKLVPMYTVHPYETPSNWLQYNGSGYQSVALAPSTLNNVFIKPNSTCITAQPTVTTTGAQANNLTIGTSATLTNNNATTLTVAGNWSNSGTYIENQGKIVFTGSSKTISNTSGETFYNLDFNSGSSISMNSDVNVLNALGLAGTVTTGSKVFWLKNSAGDATSLPDFSGKIVGTFKRDIANNTSTYSFPVARTTDGTRYLAQIINSNMNGVSFINGSVRALTESGNNVDSRIVARQGDLLTNVIEGSIWSLVPNTQPTSGSYGVRLYNTSGLPDNQFCPVKRPGGSSDYNQWDTFQGTTLIPNAGSAGRTASSGYTERLGYTSFSEHAIATTPGTLPVKLSFFKANCTNKTQAEIKWQTLTERNSERFEIEKSLDGDIFNVIANIPAAGNSNNPINYAYIDNLNLNETTYYRLNQYDLDGTKNILEVKSINCENNTLDLDVVFPVPVVENLNATISSSYNRLVKLEIYNAIGQVVYFNSLNIETGNNRVTLNNFEIANGAYLLKISDNADNSLFVAKQFVINK